MRKIVFLVGSTTFVIGLVFSSSAWATLKFQKKAKELGYEFKNCLYCHNEKLPKKDSATYNERGQWLVDQKKERKAEEIDVSWLKDFVEESAAEEN